MDPDTTLNDLRTALIERDIEAACAAFDALDSWLAKGGFLPDRWERPGTGTLWRRHDNP